MSTTPIKDEPGGLLSLFKDPDGNELCLWQSPELPTAKGTRTICDSAGVPVLEILKSEDGTVTVFEADDMDNKLLFPASLVSALIHSSALWNNLLNGLKVCICECKDLSFAGTITEVTEQLSRFRGHHGDELWKHLRRAEWLKSHPRSLSRLLGTVPSQVQALIVTSKIVPMQFLNDFPVTIVASDDLAVALSA